MVDEGDLVTAGQILGRLDDDPYQRELREARAQAGSLKARWELLRAGYRSEDVAQARATLADRKATLENAEKTLRRLHCRAPPASGRGERGCPRCRHRLISLDGTECRSRCGVRQRYQAGEAALTDVLDVERSLNQLTDLRAQSAGRVLLDFVSLQKALGGGWQTASWPTQEY